MFKKTVLRRLCKHINLNFDNIEQGKAWEDGSDMAFDNKPIEAATEQSDLEKELMQNGDIKQNEQVNFVDTNFEEVKEGE